MVRKFERGNVYIVKRVESNAIWIVRQTGQKSWDAIQMSHLQPLGEQQIFLHGNGTSLYEIMNVRNHVAFPEREMYNAKFREKLFEVLKTGRLD